MTQLQHFPESKLNMLFQACKKVDLYDVKKFFKNNPFKVAHIEIPHISNMYTVSALETLLVNDNIISELQLSNIIEIIQILFNYGASPNTTYGLNKDKKLFHYCFRFNNRDILNVFLKSGYKVDYDDFSHITLLDHRFNEPNAQMLLYSFLKSHSNINDNEEILKQSLLNKNGIFQNIYFKFLLSNASIKKTTYLDYKYIYNFRSLEEIEHIRLYYEFLTLRGVKFSKDVEFFQWFLVDLDLNIKQNVISMFGKKDHSYSDIFIGNAKILYKKLTKIILENIDLEIDLRQLTNTVCDVFYLNRINYKEIFKILFNSKESKFHCDQSLFKKLLYSSVTNEQVKFLYNEGLKLKALEIHDYIKVVIENDYIYSDEKVEIIEEIIRTKIKQKIKT